MALAFVGLPLGEGLAVCALIHRGVALVGADLDLAQGAVVLGVAVMLAGSDRAGDTFIGFAVHKKVLLFLWDRLSMPLQREEYQAAAWQFFPSYPALRKGIASS